MEQAHVMLQSLDLFCISSGQKVSEEKTKIFFSQNVHNNRHQEISDVLGFSRTSDLGKYLGVPIHHNRVSRQTYQFWLDKANQRLSGWKAHALSFAGRIILTQSVLAALPTYVMQTINLPKQVCGELDKKCRSFI